MISNQEEVIENEEQEEEQPSPLAEADPTSLDELFTSIDKKLIANLPREITDSEITRVVDYLWSQRERFLKDEANMIRPGRKAASPAKKSPKDLAEALAQVIKF